LAKKPLGGKLFGRKIITKFPWPLGDYFLKEGFISTIIIGWLFLILITPWRNLVGLGRRPRKVNFFIYQGFLIGDRFLRKGLAPLLFFLNWIPILPGIWPFGIRLRAQGNSSH